MADNTTSNKKSFLSLAASKNDSNEGMDINKMMSQASSFKKGKNRRKTEAKMHQVNISRSDFTPEVYSHELNYQDDFQFCVEDDDAV